MAAEELRHAPHISGSFAEGDKFVLLPEEKDLADGGGGFLEPATRSSSMTPREIYHNYHDKLIFSAELLSRWPAHAEHCTIGASGMSLELFSARGWLPALPEEFEGRQISMHELIKHILQRRLVSLVGRVGVGKSVMAAAVCKYLSDREVFSDAVYFFRANGCRSFESFLKGLINMFLQSGNSAVASHFRSLCDNRELEASLEVSDEEIVIRGVERRDLLLVIDHADDLLDDATATNAMKSFLTAIFDRSQKIKILMV